MRFCRRSGTEALRAVLDALARVKTDGSPKS